MIGFAPSPDAVSSRCSGRPGCRRKSRCACRPSEPGPTRSVWVPLPKTSVVSLMNQPIRVNEAWVSWGRSRDWDRPAGTLGRSKFVIEKRQPTSTWVFLAPLVGQPPSESLVSSVSIVVRLLAEVEQHDPTRCPFGPPTNNANDTSPLGIASKSWSIEMPRVRLERGRRGRQRLLDVADEVRQRRILDHAAERRLTETLVSSR